MPTGGVSGHTARGISFPRPSITPSKFWAVSYLKNILNINLGLLHNKERRMGTEALATRGLTMWGQNVQYQALLIRRIWIKNGGERGGGADPQNPPVDLATLLGTSHTQTQIKVGFLLTLPNTE